MGLLVTLLIVLTAGSLYINYYISKKIWTPFRAILNYLKIYDLDKDNSERTEKLKITEFDELTVSVNDLISRVKKTYTAQKEFTENASHELQTPLAVITSKLDLFLQEKSLSEHQSVLIGEMNTAISGLEKLNRSLLLLAKIDNGQYQSNENLDLATIVEQSISELSFFADADDIVVNFQIDNRVQLVGNYQLYGQMVKNLLINAIKYSEKDSVIKIVLTEHELIFSNPGNPLPFDDAKLFKRFSKPTSVKKGNGLGLSISEKIAELHHQKIAYTYHANTHYFTVALCR